MRVCDGRLSSAEWRLLLVGGLGAWSGQGRKHQTQRTKIQMIDGRGTEGWDGQTTPGQVAGGREVGRSGTRPRIC